MTEQVLVVGGGVVGCAIARALAPDYDVTVVEKHAIGQGASVRAAGLVTIATAYPGQERLVSHALDAFRAFDGQHGFTFHELPSLEFPSNRGPLPDRISEQRKKGVDVDYVSPEGMADCYPELNVPDDGCIRFNRTGWVVPSELITALQQSATGRGVTFETGFEVSGFTVENGRITAVDTDAGSRSPDEVIIAAGWQTPALLKGLVKLPVRPYWTQCVELGVSQDLSDVPMGWIPTEDVYWRPTRSGTLLLGGGSSFAVDPANASTDESEPFRRRMTDIFPRIIDDTSDAHYIQGWAGVDGATPDSYPIIDRPPAGPDNLVIASGFHGRGIMTAFTAGAAVRGLLTGKSPIPLGPFVLDRFDSRSTDFEFINVSA